MSVLTVEKVSHGFGGRQILEDASFRLNKGRTCRTCRRQWRRKDDVFKYYYRKIDARCRDGQLVQSHHYRIPGPAQHFDAGQNHPGGAAGGFRPLF